MHTHAAPANGRALPITSYPCALRPQPLAQALVATLKRAEPPICVGLYARSGAGKTFMLSLVAEMFDKTVRKDSDTRQLRQFFEDGYDKLGPEQQAPADETLCSLILGLLRTILFCFIPVVPYWMTTFDSIIRDAFDIREASRKAWDWCSKLQRSCEPRAKTTESGDGVVGKEKKESIYGSCMAGLYNKLPDAEDNEQLVEEKEFIFVHFNAWECAACLSSLVTVASG